MKSQAQRAETVYLQALYASIADNWDKLAAQMQATDRAERQKRGDGTDNRSPPPSELKQKGDKRAPL